MHRHIFQVLTFLNKPDAGNGIVKYIFAQIIILSLLSGIKTSLNGLLDKIVL